MAERSGKDVADVPLATIAQAAGMSRSTLVRRLKGSRQALDEAVRATGVDPGGRPVRVRAIEAGARLVSDRGLATVTLEAVAEAADCSVHSLYAIFGTRDELFAAIYERYSPLRDVLRLSADPSAPLDHTVAEFYRMVAATLTREPRSLPRCCRTCSATRAASQPEFLPGTSRGCGPRWAAGWKHKCGPGGSATFRSRC